MSHKNTSEPQSKTNKELSQIKRLLLLLAVPVVFFILMQLKFIFIPLMGALFVALLFMPMIRKMENKGWPKWLNVTLCTSIIVIFIIIVIQVIQLSSAEIFNTEDNFIEVAEERLNILKAQFESFMAGGEDIAQKKLGNNKVSMNDLRPMLEEKGMGILSGVLGGISRFFMFIFFLVLLIAGSLNVQRFMEVAIFDNKIPSIKTFISIEKSIVKFIWVKFLLSFFTGLGFTIVCYSYNVSFPIFWGFFTFAINFVQMIGSIIAVIVVTIFGMIELHAPGVLLGFALALSGVQVLFGGILEPILMGKSFSINTVTVLVMLALWGFLWGIPGLIMSVPITVLIKTIMEQIPSTRKYAELMS